MTNVNKGFVLKLQAIINTAIDGIITIDKDGLVEEVNPAAAILFEYEPTEIMGNNIKMLMPNPYHEEHDGYLDRYNKTKVPHIIGIGREVKGLKKSGVVFPFRLAVSEVILNDRVIFTGIIHDLTDVKKAQDEIIELNNKLENIVTERTYDLESTVNKLLSTNETLKHEIHERSVIEEKLRESEDDLRVLLSKEKELGELKSRFVSMASHEFRTPLTSILSSAAIIGRYTESDQQISREKHIKRIKKAVTNLTGILNDFLSLNKLEEGVIEVHLSELNLELLCQEVIEDTQGLLKKNQKIVHHQHGEKVDVIVDERILRNILFNILSNAIKYSEKDVYCDISFKEDYFEIKITDHGIGIPLEDQRHLFGRFFRAGNVSNIQGTGLGLNIVKRYIDLLNGDISFESEHEKGTTFFVKLPYQK